MLKFRHRFFRCAVFATVALWCAAATACNVPVFRYALERWEVDVFDVLVFQREPLNPDQQALVTRMEQAGLDGLANLSVHNVSLADGMSPSLRALWNEQEKPELPWMVVRYPRPASIETSAWSGPLNEPTVDALLDSPVRRNIVQMLLSGEAVVWVLLESGDKRRDDEAAQLVETELRKLERTLMLPEPSPLDPPINPDLPLKIAFSTVRVSRSDPAERALVNLLLNANPNLPSTPEVMLFPVFGRGRVLPPAVGKDIRAAAIQEMATFLVGPCSCEIKDQNPGHDLLMTANWSSMAGYQEVMLPDLPLVGLSQFVAPATNMPAPVAKSPNVSVVASASPGVPVRGNLVRNVAVVFGIGVLFLAATTFLLRARANRRSR